MFIIHNSAPFTTLVMLFILKKIRKVYIRCYLNPRNLTTQLYHTRDNPRSSTGFLEYLFVEVESYQQGRNELIRQFQSFWSQWSCCRMPRCTGTKLQILGLSLPMNDMRFFLSPTLIIDKEGKFCVTQQKHISHTIDCHWFQSIP